MLSSKFTAGLLKNRYLIGLIVIAIVAIALRVPNFNESIWLDELWSTYQKLGSFRSLAHVAISDVHPPFYTMFMFVWIRVFGDSEIAVRMPALLFGIGSIWLTYAVGSRLVDRKAALLAAFLMSISPVHIWYSQEARAYSGLVFFLLLAILAQLKLDEPDARRFWLYIYFAAMLFCVLTHFYLAAFLILVSFIVIQGKHRHSRQILLINGLILSLLVAFVAAKVVVGKLATTSGYLRAFTPQEFFDLFFNWFAFGNSFDTDRHPIVFLLLQLLYAAVLISGLILLLRSWESYPRSRQTILYLFVLPLALLGLAAVGATNYIERSVLVAMPFFFLVFAAGVTGIRWNTARAICVLIVAGLGMAALASYFSRQDVWTVYKPNADWKAAVVFFKKENSRDGRATSVLTVTPSDELTYYNPEFRQRTTAELDAENARVIEPDTGSGFLVYRVRPDQTQAAIDKLMRDGHDHFYLVENQFWEGPFKDVFRGITSDERLQNETVNNFKGLVIYRFSIGGRSPELSHSK